MFKLLIFFDQGFAPACHCDGLVEVVGLQGVMHLVRKANLSLFNTELFFIVLVYI